MSAPQIQAVDVGCGNDHRIGVQFCFAVIGAVDQAIYSVCKVFAHTVDVVHAGVVHIAFLHELDTCRESILRADVYMSFLAYRIPCVVHLQNGLHGCHDKVGSDQNNITFRMSLESSGETGKKMDFLIQEMNRETNTIGSKASDTVIAQHVVDLKSEIEKLREQIQNVE